MSDEDHRSIGADDNARVRPRSRASGNEQRRSENTIAPARTRQRSRADDPLIASLERHPQHEVAAAPVDAKARKGKPSLEVGNVPEEIAERYVSQAQGNRRGYYLDVRTKDAAFYDAGNKLSAVRTDPRVISDMLKVAEHRNWKTLAVSGTEEFRREVWMQGRQRGIAITGYKPTERDQQDLEHRRQAPSRQPSPDVREIGRAKASNEARVERHSGEGGVTGKLIEMGTAPYQNRKSAQPSPYVKLETEGGRTKTLWGAGLPDAVQRAGAERGDTVTVRRDGFEQISKQVMLRDRETGKPLRAADTGKPVTEEMLVKRALWSATAEKFLHADKEARLKDPALRGAESQMRVVDGYLTSRIADPAVRDRLLAGAREGFAKALSGGVEVPGARIHSVVKDKRLGERHLIHRSKPTDSLLERTPSVPKRQDPERERSR